MIKFFKLSLMAALISTPITTSFAQERIYNVENILDGLVQIAAVRSKKEKEQRELRRKTRKSTGKSTGVKQPKVKKPVYGPTKRNVRFKTKHKPGSIVIKTSERKIYFIKPNGKAIQYGIAIGKTARRQWKGVSYITRKRPNPTWIPTASILRENPGMKRVYKPGPNNPLGVRALNLANTPTLRIHGTNQPHTIGKAVSHGCFRMRNQDVIDLYDRVKVGTRVYVES